MTTHDATVDAAALRAAVAGKVSVPGDADWDAARAAWNLAVDQHPTAVVFPSSAADVVAAVRFAREAGLGIAAQGTGHGAQARTGTLEGVLLVNTARMDGVEIDAEARIAKVEAGAVWKPVTDAAAEHGLAPLAGSSPDVGVVGYSLGGGIGWLGRQYGLAGNSIRAIEVVTADGRLVRADAETEQELFWALRGGAVYGLAVVTAIELDLYPVAQVYAGTLLWPIELAGDVLNAYRTWAEGLPDEVTTAGRLLLNLPPIEAVPEPMRGRSFVGVIVAAALPTEQAEELMRPLRELAPPFMDMLAPMPASELWRINMDPEEPVPSRGDQLMLTDLTPEAIQAVVEQAATSSLLVIDIRQLGGAMAVDGPTHGVLSSLDAGYVVFGVGMVMAPELVPAIDASLDGLFDALAPWATGRTYANFVDRGRTDRPSPFGPEVTRRLAAVKAAVDPDGLLRGTHELVA